MRTPKTVVTLVIAIIVASMVFALYQYRERKKAENAINLAATAMLQEIFTAKKDLRVGQLSGVVVARSEYKGSIFQSTQQTRAPVTVDYILSLNKIDRGDLNWNPKSHQLTVRIPEVTVDRPNIDFMKAEINQNGFWIGRGAGIIMQHQAVERIVGRADERARDTKNINHARQQAIDFVTQLVVRPLDAVGYGPVTVKVVAPWNQQPSDERWDLTRSLDEVLANAN